LSFIANELSKPPWNFNLDEDHEVDLTINNLDKFAEPYGRLLLFEVDGQITGTISLRKIREYSGEIKRMYVRPKIRGEKLGNLLIEEVIRVSKENGFSKLIWWIVRFLFQPPYIVI
jgi:GNAT superfamily N-acetyltransferase